MIRYLIGTKYLEIGFHIQNQVSLRACSSLRTLLFQDYDEGIDLSNGTSNQHQQENEKNRRHTEGEGPPGPFIYELFSIMIHSGSASGGHYYVYIKDFDRGEWFCFDDQSVSRVSIQNTSLVNISFLQI